jgi:holo-[acyl-carrier protein] synthase
LGIGVDIVDIERIRAAMRSPRFLTRILRPDETRPCPSAEWVAGRWAAKEATAKALGIHLKWHDVAIVSGPDGKPAVQLAKRAESQNLAIHLSISHERNCAVAMVVAESVERSSDTI